MAKSSAVITYVSDKHQFILATVEDIIVAKTYVESYNASLANKDSTFQIINSSLKNEHSDIIDTVELQYPKDDVPDKPKFPISIRSSAGPEKAQEVYDEQLSEYERVVSNVRYYNRRIDNLQRLAIRAALVGRGYSNEDVSDYFDVIDNPSVHALQVIEVFNVTDEDSIADVITTAIRDAIADSYDTDTVEDVSV